ncbi:MAG: lysylphosphatidylglycerol synthase transmembrane domain-containing protein [Promethearchaeota archaeon]
MEDKSYHKLISWLRRNYQVIIGLITICLIVLMILFVDFINLLNKIILIGLYGTILFVIVYTFTFILRSYKLKLIFIGLNRKVSYSICYFSIGTAFAINEVIPAKIGDLAKIVFLKEHGNLKLSESFGGTAIERALDLFILFFISLFALIYISIIKIDESDTITLFGFSLQFYIILATIVIFVVLTFLILILFKTDFCLGIVGKISKKIENYFRNFITNLKGAIRSFKEHKKEFLVVLILSCVIWIIEAFIGIIFFYLVGFNLNFFILILALLFTYFSKSFPITPEGWGISENLGAIFVLIFYPSIPYLDLLSIFIIEHLFRSAYIFFYGGYSIFHFNFNLKHIKQIK